MELRETINRHPIISTTVMICLAIAGVVAIVIELKGDDGKPPAKSFFTINDGQTWFTDSSSKLPPFDRGAEKAVRCYVFRGKHGDFAGLLEKYNDETRNRLASRDPREPLRDPPPILVKKPGESDWKNVGPDAEAMILMHICEPDGSSAERVMP